MTETAKMTERCVTPMATVSFPKVFKAEAFGEQEPKFSVTLLFDKKTDLSGVKKAMHAACVKKWGEDKAKWPKGLRSPLRDGDEKSDLAGYAGNFYIAASNKLKPEVVDKSLQPISEESDEFYAGCKARAALRAYAYDTKGNKGVTFSLESLQKLADGERFSGRKRAADVFEAMSDEESEMEEMEMGF